MRGKIGVVNSNHGVVESKKHKQKAAVPNCQPECHWLPFNPDKPGWVLRSIPDHRVSPGDIHIDPAIAGFIFPYLLKTYF
jgi:hypothetical protein